MASGRRTGLIFAVISLTAFLGNPLQVQAEQLTELKQWLGVSASERPSLESQAWAKQAIDSKLIPEVRRLLWEDYVEQEKGKRLEELKKMEIVIGDKSLRFLRKDFGDVKLGRKLLISMHGGGGAPKALNDQQWRNQIRLYKLDNGVMVAPRAPTNTWNLWHQGHIDGLFDRLIQDFVIFEGVDPDQVYLTGYSAGGDGVYQLAPRMADRFAGAAMMAGHPNETIPDGLRNLPFALYMGGKDAAYKRNEIAKSWGEKLEKLQSADKAGYKHSVVVFPEFGHWMNGKDAAGIEWMMKYHRNELPERVVWVQDDVKHARLYWLACDPDSVSAGNQLIVSRSGNRFNVEKSDLKQFSLLLNEEMVDTNEPIEIVAQGKTQKVSIPDATIGNLYKTLQSRGIANAMMPFRVEVILE